MLMNSIRTPTVFRVLVLSALILVSRFFPTEFASPLLVLIGFSIMAFGKIQRSYIKLIWPLLTVLIIGSLGISDHESRHILRDIAFALTPISLIYTGYWIADDNGMWPLTLKVIMVFALFFAIIHLSAFVIDPDLLRSDVDTLRLEVGATGDIVVIALLMGVFQSRFEKFKLFPKLFPRIIALPVLLASFLLSYSRTQTIVAILIVLSMLNLLSKMNNRFIVCAIFLIITTYATAISTPINEVGTFRSKFASSLSEITISDYGTMQEINKNWRGYESYKTLESFSSGSLLQQIFGQGFGSLVDLGYAQELAGQEYRFIPITHNGYVYILLKSGVVGLLMYMAFYINIFRATMHYVNVLSHESKVYALFLLGCVLSLASTMFVIGGMAEMHNTEMVFLLGYFSRRFWLLHSGNILHKDGRIY